MEKNLKTTKRDSEDNLALPEGKTYKDAITILRNRKTLKSPEIRQWRFSLERKMTDEETLRNCVQYLNRSGLSLEQLDTLNVIHVAGTKGKGSTCAFVESILRHAGLRTGFFSSPHLFAVRERIRINGKPITEIKFAQYFFQVYENMEKKKESEHDFPLYFRFLTCMALYVFYYEKVDVVILEVGIGGKRDSTNIVKKPIVTGIASLGLDHQWLLGNTLKDIALAKAGIMKPGVTCFTLPTHPSDILTTLQNYAASVQCPLLLATPLEAYKDVPTLGINYSPIASLNASLALQLANTFLQIQYPEILKPQLPQQGTAFELFAWHRDGLANCVWHGRFQVVHRNPSLTYYIDAAHTLESLKAAVAWFNDSCERNPSTSRYLVFNLLDERDAELLRPLAMPGLFECAIICPILILKPPPSGGSDDWILVEEEVRIRKRADDLYAAWQNFSSDTKCHMLPSLDHVVEHFDKLSNGRNVSVLVTASTQLVGSILSLLCPELNS